MTEEQFQKAQVLRDKIEQTRAYRDRLEAEHGKRVSSNVGRTGETVTELGGQTWYDVAFPAESDPECMAALCRFHEIYQARLAQSLTELQQQLASL